MASNVSQSKPGLFGRIAQFFSSAFKTGITDAKEEMTKVLHEITIADVGEAALAIGNIVAQVMMNNMFMNGPASVEEGEAGAKKMQGKMLGITLLSGATNMAGSIPSLGQVSNVGESMNNIINNVGMQFMNWQMMMPMVQFHNIKPMEHSKREEAKAETLSQDEIKTAYNKGLLSEEEMNTQLSDHGYDEQYSTAIKKLSLNNPDIGVIQNMFSSGAISQDQAAVYLRQAGYATEDIPNLMQGIVNGQTQVLHNDMINVLREMAKDEQISQTQFSELLQKIGYTADQINREVTALEGLNSLRTIQTEINSLGESYKQGIVSIEQLGNKLADLGLEDQQIIKVIENLTSAVETSNPNVQLVAIERAFTQGITTTDQYVKQLMEQGLSEETALNKAVTTLNAISKQGGTHKDLGLLTQTHINIAYAEGLIDQEAFRLISSEVGTSEETVGVLLSTLSHHQRKSSQPIPMDILLNAFRYNTVTREEALSLLQASGYSTQMATIILDTITHEISAANGGVGIGNGNNGNGGVETGGLDINQISPVRLTELMSTFEIKHDVQTSVVSTVYNMMIRGGFINQDLAIKLLGEIGIAPEIALTMVG